jgi:uncharacterized protein (DUF697 family)
MALPLSLAAVRGLLKELAASARNDSPLVVGGARELAAVLRREIGRGAVAGAVRDGEEPEGAAVLVYVLGRDPDEEDEAALARARRARVPIVAVAAGPVSDDVAIPQVRATDLVKVGAGEGFPLGRIAETIARVLGEDGAALAARVPLLRRAVCDALVASVARRNGLIGAAVFIRGADLPLLTLNQLRLVLRIAQAHGADIGRDRLPDLAATVGFGFGFRAVARELVDLLAPGRRFAGWAVKGAVAWAGTRALGEVAVRRFDLGSADAGEGASATPPPASISPDGP